jgi:hypothetical protein
MLHLFRRFYQEAITSSDHSEIRLAHPSQAGEGAQSQMAITLALQDEKNLYIFARLFMWK